MIEPFMMADESDPLIELVSNPPNDISLEQAILGTLLLNPDWMPEVLHVQPCYFYRESHRILFEAMKALFEAAIPVDNVSVANHLTENGLIQTVTNSYILELMTSQPEGFLVSIHSLHHWLNKLAQLAERREVLKLAYALAENASSLDCSDYLSKALEELQDVAMAFTPDPESDFAQSVEAASLAIQNKAISHQPIGIPPGFKKLDEKTSGFQPGQLIILGARPGAGKTALALNMALHSVLKNQSPVLFFSLEMATTELMERALKCVADSSFDTQKLALAKESLLSNRERLKVIDTPNLSLSDIQAMAHRWHKKANGQGLIVVDHLALIAQPESRYQNRNLELEKTTWGLKSLAKTLGVPVLLLCQLNRSVETRQDKRPLLSDLRDSGAIEQNADLVMFLHGEDPVNKTLTLEKHRNGSKGDVPLLFKAALTKFVES